MQRQPLFVQGRIDDIPPFAQIVPSRIALFNQRNLLRANPSLQLLFARDCAIRSGKPLEPDQSVAVISIGEPHVFPLFVLEDAFQKIAGHTDIERVAPVGHDVRENRASRSWRKIYRKSLTMASSLHYAGSHRRSRAANSIVILSDRSAARKSKDLRLFFSKYLLKGGCYGFQSGYRSTAGRKMSGLRQRFCKRQSRHWISPSSEKTAEA